MRGIDLVDEVEVANGLTAPAEIESAGKTEVGDGVAARAEFEAADKMEVGAGVAAPAKVEPELPEGLDNGIEAVAAGAGIDSVELGFAELGLVEHRSIDLGYDSLAEFVTELVQPIEVAIQDAQVDDATEPAATSEPAVELAEAPEVGIDVRQQVGPGAVMVESAGLQGLMEALRESADMVRVEFELPPSIELGAALPQVL